MTKSLDLNKTIPVDFHQSTDKDIAKLIDLILFSLLATFLPI